jgi:hypothetical protein
MTVAGVPPVPAPAQLQMPPIGAQLVVGQGAVRVDRLDRPGGQQLQILAAELGRRDPPGRLTRGQPQQLHQHPPHRRLRQPAGQGVVDSRHLSHRPTAPRTHHPTVIEHTSEYSDSSVACRYTS